MRAFYPEKTLVGIDVGFYQHLITDELPASETNLDKLIFKDVRNIQDEDLKGVDSIVHLAAVSNDPMGKSFEKATIEINRDSTFRLAKIAKKAGVKKFIFASSASVYGFTQKICNEKSELNPLTAYAKSKAEAEILLQEIASDNFEVTILRFATACGWSSRLRTDLVLNQFVFDAVSQNSIKLNSNGESFRPLVSTNDMGKAINWALSEDRNKLEYFEIVNVGQNEWNFKIIDLAKIVKNRLPNTEIQFDDQTMDTRSYKLEFSKYNSICGVHILNDKIEDIIDELTFNIENLIQAKQNLLDKHKRLLTLEKRVRENLIDADLNNL
jgi:nucleoside-diphosphate-sugar epimerase